MTETEITTPGGTFSQQFGQLNAHVEKFLPLSIGLKSSSDGKMKEIFELMKTRPLNKDDKEILEIAIDNCKCKTYTTTRISNFYEKRVIKTSHPQH